MSEQKKNKEQTAQDIAPDIQDVIVNKKTSSVKAKAKAASGKAVLSEANKQYLVLFGVIAAALTVILISVMGLAMPVVAVCLIVLLEAGIAVCLNNEPVWLHGAVVVVELITGAVFSKLLFMALCTVVYIVSILALKFLRE